MSETSGDETETARLVAKFVEWDLDQAPVRATALGAPGRDHALGDFSAAGIEQREREERRWLERFESVERSGLELDEAIDVDLVRSVLSGRAVMHDWQEWRRSPDEYLGACLYGVFLLFLQGVRGEGQLVDDAVERLGQVPEVLAVARDNLDPEASHPLLVRRALGMCQAGAAYARDFLPTEVDDVGLRDRLGEAGAAAAADLDGFARFLEELAETASGEFAIGEERYSRRLREQEGLGYGASELSRRGREAYDELAAEMARRAREIDGSEDFRAVIREINEDHPSTPEEMRDLYADWTARARAFLVEHDLVTFPPGERCEVAPSPPFQRPVLAVASYSRPPAFTDSRVGHFFVPYPPDEADETEVQRRLSTNSRAMIPSISVHEAYPGHHWHLATAAGNPSVARKVYGTPYFAEGWGLYTEQMMREQGFFPDPRMELLQLDMRLFRAARIVVDTALHSGEMTPDEATAFMEERAGLSEPVARAEVARYCAWPTQAASYLTGSLEIERMRERYRSERGGGLKAFHDTIAASGVLPLALAERALMES